MSPITLWSHIGAQEGEGLPKHWTEVALQKLLAQWDLYHLPVFILGENWR